MEQSGKPPGPDATRRSDEICWGQHGIHILDIREDMIGVWSFHDYSSHVSHESITLGLFRAIGAS